ncbi:type II toxin-antitoxin system VapB family antitoxin [Caulobacter flavus]|nr:type II toxin-antitoxin system VapB family antitoxin [Caulobacter flavus]
MRDLLQLAFSGVLFGCNVEVMGMVIHDEETLRMAQELADRKGLAAPDVLKELLRAELERTVPAESRPSRFTPEEREAIAARIAAIQARVEALPVLDPRHPDDMLYDEDGLPK